MLENKAPGSRSPFDVFTVPVQSAEAPRGTGFLNSRIKPPGKGDVDMAPER